MGCINDLI